MQNLRLTLGSLFIFAEEEQLRLKRLHFRKTCDVQHLDKKFLTHLSEMHPTSALHELCQRLGWPAPTMVEAFGCGPPTMRMSIFKVTKKLLICLDSRIQFFFCLSLFIYQATVNGNSYQPTIAVMEKKDAKANAAWLALQELGFVKKDPANPL